MVVTASLLPATEISSAFEIVRHLPDPWPPLLLPATAIPPAAIAVLLPPVEEATRHCRIEITKLLNK
jgi:hypothetical protein